MKILSITSASLSSSSGSGYSVGSFSTALRNEGHVVQMIGPNEYEPLRGWSRGVKPRQFLGAPCSAWKYDLKQIDLLLCYGDEFALLGMLAKLINPRVKVVWHTNGFELAELEARERWNLINGVGSAVEKVKMGFYRRFSLQFLRQVDGLVTLSDADAEVARRFATRIPVAVVFPGISDAYSAPREPHVRDTDILFVGSWIARKGIALFADTCTRLARAGVISKIEIAGTGLRPSEVLSQFAEDVQPQVIVHPHLQEEELAHVFRRSKLLLLPSYYEGFGLVAAQAAASGVGLVMGPTGWASSLNPGKEYYQLSNYTAGELAAGLQKLLSDDVAREQMAHAAGVRAAALSWKRAGRELSDFLEVIRLL